MRIALFSDTYHPITDGVSRHLVDYKEELERRGHSVRVYTVFSTNDGVFGLPSFKFPLYKEYRVGFPVYELYRDLRRFNPDVVHIHTPFVLGTMGHRYARKNGIPTVGTYHTDFVNMDNTLKFPFVKSLLNLGFQYNMHLYKKLDLVVAPSQVTADHLREFGNESKIVHIGINLNKFVYCNQKDNYYLFVGRLTNDKGVTELLDVASEMPDKKFKIAGTGPLRSTVENAIKEHGNIEYLGYVPEPKKIELLSKAKVLIMLSRAETFGVAYVEAMASGTPVIGSTESREIGILKENYNGWSVNFGDSDGLRAKLEEIDGIDLTKYSENARLSSMNYSIEAATSALESLYGELIGSKTGK